MQAYPTLKSNVPVPAQLDPLMRLSDGGSELPRLFVISVVNDHGTKVYRSKCSLMRWSPVLDDNAQTFTRFGEAMDAKVRLLEFGHALRLDYYQSAKIEEVVNA
jgi:hypothetical protein